MESDQIIEFNSKVKEINIINCIITSNNIKNVSFLMQNMTNVLFFNLTINDNSIINSEPLF